ncbi:MAG TPA: hypothetical protein VN083_01945 [Vicinamibacteria bacterium]|nr:hypothetical protein [Vicinamibacteria bacterium]
MDMPNERFDGDPRGRRRALLAVSWVVALTSLLGCGSSTTPTPVATPTPAPQTTILAQAAASGIQPGTGYVVVLNPQVAGTLSATVDWTFPSTTMVLGWATGDCTVNASCPTLPGTTPAAAATKPATTSTPLVQPGTYSFVFVSSQLESVAYTVTLTH